jgi:hypothetical protein
MQLNLVVDMWERSACTLLSSADCLAHVHALLRNLTANCDVGHNTDGRSQGCKVASNEVAI